MADIEKKPVKIVETVLRDAHQSLLATRMTTEQMLPSWGRWTRLVIMQLNAGAVLPLIHACAS